MLHIIPFATNLCLKAFLQFRSFVKNINRFHIFIYFLLIFSFSSKNFHCAYGHMNVNEDYTFHIHPRFPSASHNRTEQTITSQAIISYARNPHVHHMPHEIPLLSIMPLNSIHNTRCRCLLSLSPALVGGSDIIFTNSIMLKLWKWKT